MKTLRETIGIIILVCGSILNIKAQAYGEIRGIIKNTELEPISYATIKVLQGGALVSGSQTDERGSYSCKPLNPGTYELVIIHPEYPTQTIRKISVNPSEATYVDAKLEMNTFSVITITAKEYDYTNTGVDVDVFHTKSMSATDLMENSGYVRGDIKNVLTVMTSEVIADNKGELHVRGARGGATGYYVDGVRILEATSVPGLAIENISAFTGGVPAMYGDLTSGAVIITTKTYFSGIREKMVRKAIAVERAKEQKAKEESLEEEKNRAKEIELEKQKAKKTEG